MKQTADGGLKIPYTCGETSSEMNTAPVAFILNQNSAVCLPLVSNSKKLIWVHSDQITLQLDGAAELDKAFDRFPYLTEKQTVALAQRCSLHPDQVRVWFMVQRLRYGISWDCKDIPKVRRKFKLSQRNEERQKDGGENDKCQREVRESGGKTKGEVREEQYANRGRMTEEKEQTVMEEKDRRVEDKRNSQKKRKRTTVTDKEGKKRRIEVKIKSDEAERESTKSKPTQSESVPREKKKAKANKRLLSIKEWPAHKNFVVPDEPLDAPPPLTLQTQDSDVPPLTDNQTPNVCTTPVNSGFELKTEMEIKQDEELHAESTNPDGAVTDVCKPKSNCTTKTQTQLEMMKQAFALCQYPDNEGYNQLVELIGIPRHKLVQWYSDMRYYMKERRPRWLTEEQHSQALANIRYRQYLSGLAKIQRSEGGRKATMTIKLENNERCSKDETVQVPLMSH